VHGEGECAVAVHKQGMLGARANERRPSPVSRVIRSVRRGELSWAGGGAGRAPVRAVAAPGADLLAVELRTLAVVPHTLLLAVGPRTLALAVGPRTLLVVGLRTLVVVPHTLAAVPHTSDTLAAVAPHIQEGPQAAVPTQGCQAAEGPGVARQVEDHRTHHRQEGDLPGGHPTEEHRP